MIDTKYIASALLVLFIGSWASSDEKGFIYSPVGKRDPFSPPAINVFGRDPASLDPLERYGVEQLQLKAILKMKGKREAMFEDPEGKSHILFEGQSLGREHATLSRILDTSVVVTQKTFNYLGEVNLFEKVLSLPPKPSAEQNSDWGAGASAQREVSSSLTKGANHLKELESLMNTKQ